MLISVAPVAAKPQQPAERRPEQGRPVDRRPAQPGERRDFNQGQRQGERRDFNQGQRQSDRPQYQRYTGTPQENPFAKKRENMNRQAEGGRVEGKRPQQAPAVQPQKPKAVEEAAKVASTLRPAQQAQQAQGGAQQDPNAGQQGGAQQQPEDVEVEEGK